MVVPATDGHPQRQEMDQVSPSPAGQASQSLTPPADSQPSDAIAAHPRSAQARNGAAQSRHTFSKSAATVLHKPLASSRQTNPNSGASRPSSNTISKASSGGLPMGLIAAGAAIGITAIGALVFGGRSKKQPSAKASKPQPAAAAAAKAPAQTPAGSPTKATRPAGSRYGPWL